MDRLTETPTQLPPIFLKRMRIDSFGAFSNKTIGPFTPQLNVLYGKNEAGKTTMNAFFGGVLFGWEEARGGRNTYKPHNAERAGSLFFEDAETEEEFEFSRARNVDGLKGPNNLIDDIDKETFSTMFALTSDELRSLKNTSDVTAKLLTAGSGTYASPTQALGELQARISEYTSRASGIEHSIVQLKAEQEEVRAQLDVAAAEAERLKNQDREFYELEPERSILSAKLESLNTEIEAFSGYKASLERLDAQLEKTLERRDNLLQQEQELDLQHKLYEQSRNSSVRPIESSEELNYREHIDVLFEEQNRVKHRHSLAKDTYTESKARYEALLEADDVQELEHATRSSRRTQIILSVALPLLFLLAGVPVFLHGREIASLSFTAVGIGLITFAVLLAGAAMVMLFRPSKTDEELLQKKKDAQWVMLQDKKKLESCEADMTEHRAKVTEYLDGIGLDSAQGSLRRARAILDEVKEDRTQENLFIQQQQALVSQLTSLEESLSDIHEQKESLAHKLPMQTLLSTSSIESLIAQKIQQRATISETNARINRRYGEIKQELSQAEHYTRFDELKLANQQLTTRLQESAEDYARLLLAKRMLETAINAWESKSQPEVYKQASRLLSLMTDGAWVQVRMTGEGRLQVVDAVKTVREPMHLSLGTCQQLYLSLRIALLLAAENVGRIIPIMADDILVNFDETRRLGAIRALFELAEKRQVIIFTCHKEIVSLMQSSDSPVNMLEL
ncbi:MAG: ATP-binding protein [Raoultibacter sp.]|jgi:uncharacterized protein YhaN